MYELTYNSPNIFTRVILDVRISLIPNIFISLHLSIQTNRKSLKKTRLSLYFIHNLIKRVLINSLDLIQ